MLLGSLVSLGCVLPILGVGYVIRLGLDPLYNVLIFVAVSVVMMIFGALIISLLYHAELHQVGAPHSLFGIFGLLSNGWTTGAALVAILPKVYAASVFILAMYAWLHVGMALEERRRRLGIQVRSPILVGLTTLTSGLTAGALAGGLLPFVDLISGAIGGFLVGFASLRPSLSRKVEGS